MDFRGFKVHIAVIVMIVTIAALAGASYLYREQHLQRPLASAISAIAPVKSLEVTYANGHANINLTLGAVADLRQAYDSIDQAATRTYGTGNYVLNIKGDSDATLDAFYTQAQYYVWQGVQQGDYAAMAGAIQSQAQARGLENTRFSVTASNVFLQSTDADGHSLYVIVPRTQAMGGVAQ